MSDEQRTVSFWGFLGVSAAFVLQINENAISVCRREGWRDPAGRTRRGRGYLASSKVEMSRFGNPISNSTVLPPARNVGAGVDARGVAVGIGIEAGVGAAVGLGGGLGGGKSGGEIGGEGGVGLGGGGGGGGL